MTHFFRGLWLRLAAALALSVLLSVLPARAVLADGLVIVLDPGHGGDVGEDQGAQYAPYSEKDLTLFTAQLLKAELELYDGVTVLMTRTENTDVSLSDRVAFACEAGADFLYSLHFNATGTHTVNGSEIYISIQKPMYERSFPLAWNTLNELRALGFYPKGVRVRIGRSGVTDYYGILRMASESGLPAAIVEHCYLDNPTDRAFLASDPTQVRACAAFAHADAEAIAKTFRLRSTALGKDYSAFQSLQVQVPTEIVTVDLTHAALGLP